MITIEPVSSLSIKRAVNLYTIILLLSFGALLYWLASDRYQTFIDTHESIAHDSSRLAAFQISKILTEKRREVNIYTEDHKDVIRDLATDPQSSYLWEQLIARMKKQQPDMTAIRLLSGNGEIMLGDKTNNIAACLDDFRHFTDSDEQLIRLHPDADSYHYDILSRISKDPTDPIVLSSFDVDEITELLNATQSQQHNLVLVNKVDNPGPAIGITSEGNVKNIVGGLNFAIRNGINLSMISKTPVKGSNWYVVDMSDTEFFTDYRNKTLKEYSIAFYIFAIIVIFMRYILLKQDAKRSAAEKQMHKNHEQIIALNNSLEQLSKLDSLTKLYNRRYFDDMVRHEWNRAQRTEECMTCILLDIDHFKNYNDHYGHQAGDKCIKDISDLLRDSFRRAGDIVARYGGEEFIIIMSNTSEEEAKVALIKFQLALNKLNIPHDASTTDNSVTISAGLVSMTPANDETVESFINNADSALYKAKENGRNQFVVHCSESASKWNQQV